jgi:hypothetical protein
MNRDTMDDDLISRFGALEALKQRWDDTEISEATGEFWWRDTISRIPTGLLHTEGCYDRDAILRWQDLKDSIPEPIKEWCYECDDLIQDSYGFEIPTGVGGDSQDIIFSHICGICWGRGAKPGDCPDKTLHQNRKQMSSHTFCITCGVKL